MKIESGQISASNGAKFNGDLNGNVTGTGKTSVGWLKTTVGVGAGSASHLLLCNAAGSQRWALRLAQAESSGNGGGNFVIWRYGNNSEFLDAVIEIARNTGATTICGATTITGGLSLNNGQNITNVGTIFPTIVHFPVTNGTITGDGKITFTNAGGVDFYHRNLSLVKSLSIDSSQWGSDPASTMPISMLSNSNTNIGIGMGRLSIEGEMAIASAGGQYETGSAAGDVIIKNANAGGKIILAVGTTPRFNITNAGAECANLTVNAEGVAGLPLTIRSGNSNANLAVGIGRTGNELELCVASANGHYTSGDFPSVAGDVIIRNSNASGGIIFSVNGVGKAKVTSNGMQTTTMQRESEIVTPLVTGNRSYTLLPATKTSIMSNGYYRGSNSISQPVFELTGSGSINGCTVSGVISITNTAFGLNTCRTIAINFTMAYANGVTNISQTSIIATSPDSWTGTTASLSFSNNQLMLDVNAGGATIGAIHCTWDAHYDVIVNQNISTIDNPRPEIIPTSLTLMAPTAYLKPN